MEHASSLVVHVSSVSGHSKNIGNNLPMFTRSFTKFTAFTGFLCGDSGILLCLGKFTVGKKNFVVNLLR
jgi:hypothetical protein